MKKQLETQEGRLKSNPTVTKLKSRIKLLQHQINVLLTEEIVKKIRCARQSYFESTNKPGRWLAYKIRKEREKALIHALRDEDGSNKN